MSKKFLILFLILSSNFLFSQEKECDCVEELEEVSSLIKNAKSYQIQIKKKNKEADFSEWKEKIKKEILADSLSQYFCSGYLQKYISFIKDSHNQIYLEQPQTDVDVPSYSKLIDTTQIPIDKISGIYYMGSDKILLKKESDSLWYGIMLNSATENWTKGKIRLKLKKTSDNEFEIFEFHPNARLFYQKNIQILDGLIHKTFWNKNNKYYFNKNHKENFNFETINSSFDYIGIGTFKRTNTLKKEAEAFYNNNLDKLNKENLIIDLRNNGGGSKLQAKALLKSLKNNKAIKKIYVIINFKTASATELIALELKKDNRSIVVGENSAGMLEYGYGNKAFSTLTDCSNFKVLLSTEHTKKELEEFEELGIKPDYILDNKSDWIDQIVDSQDY